MGLVLVPLPLPVAKLSSCQALDEHCARMQLLRDSMVVHSSDDLDRGRLLFEIANAPKLHTLRKHLHTPCVHVEARIAG